MQVDRITAKQFMGGGEITAKSYTTVEQFAFLLLEEGFH